MPSAAMHEKLLTLEILRYAAVSAAVLSSDRQANVMAETKDLAVTEGGAAEVRLLGPTRPRTRAPAA